MKRIAAEDNLVPSVAQSVSDHLSPTVVASAKTELEENWEVRDYNPCLYSTGMHAGEPTIRGHSFLLPAVALVLPPSVYHSLSITNSKHTCRTASTVASSTTP